MTEINAASETGALLAIETRNLSGNWTGFVLVSPDRKTLAAMPVDGKSPILVLGFESENMARVCADKICESRNVAELRDYTPEHAIDFLPPGTPVNVVTGIVKNCETICSPRHS